MTYRRVVARNQLQGDYLTERSSPDEYNASRNYVAGDMRRLETDQRDEQHLSQYARRADVTPEQAKAVLDAFFEGNF